MKVLLSSFIHNKKYVGMIHLTFLYCSKDNNYLNCVLEISDENIKELQSEKKKFKDNIYEKLKM